MRLLVCVSEVLPRSFPLILVYFFWFFPLEMFCVIQMGFIVLFFQFFSRTLVNVRNRQPSSFNLIQIDAFFYRTAFTALSEWAGYLSLTSLLTKCFSVPLSHCSIDAAKIRLVWRCKHLLNIDKTCARVLTLTESFTLISPVIWYELEQFEQRTCPYVDLVRLFCSFHLVFTSK